MNLKEFRHAQNSYISKVTSFGQQLYSFFRRFWYCIGLNIALKWDEISYLLYIYIYNSVAHDENPLTL